MSYDQFVDRLGGGIGFGIAKDVAGAGDLNTTHINATYSYRLQVSKKFVVNAGFEAAYRQLGIDWGQQLLEIKLILSEVLSTLLMKI